MKKSTPAQWATRIILYIIGLFFMAMGVAFAVNSNLGVSPVTSLPYVISLIVNMELGTCVITVYGVYTVLQILILRREFRLINLTQIIFSTIFGYFTNFTKWLLADFTLPTYGGQLVMLAISIVAVAFGVFLYMEVDLGPCLWRASPRPSPRRWGNPFTTSRLWWIAARWLWVSSSLCFPPRPPGHSGGDRHYRHRGGQGHGGL